MRKYNKIILAIFVASIIAAFGITAFKFLYAKSGENVFGNNDIETTSGFKTNSSEISIDRSYENTSTNIPAENNNESIKASENKSENKSNESEEVLQTPNTDNIENAKPNEAGKIMIVMFHSFVDEFNPTKYDNGEYTMTFDSFRELLYRLYEEGYRLVGLKDYLENNISIPIGYKPIVFTFDDGTSGQFNLVEEDGVLNANKNSAVGVMEEFNKIHPDFGLKGTFFVNLGASTFNGSGTVKERLEYLINNGFEIGNHTLNHVNFSKVSSIEKIQEEVGGNQKKMLELVGGYEMFALSLPYGAPSKDLFKYVISGEFEGVKYENLAILNVGAEPALSTINKNFDPYSVPRVRAPGIKPIDYDLNWWLDNISESHEFISDGISHTVTIPKEKIEDIDLTKISDKELVTYEK